MDADLKVFDSKSEWFKAAWFSWEVQENNLFLEVCLIDTAEDTQRVMKYKVWIKEQKEK